MELAKKTSRGIVQATRNRARAESLSQMLSQDQRDNLLWSAPNSPIHIVPLWALITH